MAASTLLPEEEEAKEFLEALDLQVQLVPTSTSKSPEFIVDGDARGYVVEVKARKDSEEWIRQMRRSRIASEERSLGHSRWAEDVARAAISQFHSVDEQHSKWWVLWLAIRCRASAEAMFEEAIGSLFGVRQVVYHDPNSESQTAMRNCLFAKPGVFERHLEIVASIVDSGDGLGFCVNDEFAGDFDSFRESVLWSSFASIHPPMAANDLTERQGFLRADLSVNRRDDAAVKASLERAYGLENAFILDMRVHSASTVARRRGR
jgi:hypothetical protein